MADVLATFSSLTLCFSSLVCQRPMVLYRPEEGHKKEISEPGRGWCYSHGFVWLVRQRESRSCLDTFGLLPIPTLLQLKQEWVTFPATQAPSWYCCLLFLLANREHPGWQYPHKPKSRQSETAPGQWVFIFVAATQNLAFSASSCSCYFLGMRSFGSLQDFGALAHNRGGSLPILLLHSCQKEISRSFPVR